MSEPNLNSQLNVDQFTANSNNKILQWYKQIVISNYVDNKFFVTSK
jgi:hypothetical protein